MSKNHDIYSVFNDYEALLIFCFIRKANKSNKFFFEVAKLLLFIQDYHPLTLLLTIIDFYGSYLESNMSFCFVLVDLDEKLTVDC